MNRIEVVVPDGVSQGQTFMVNYNGQMLSVVCPPGVYPGQTLVVELNAPGRSLFREAFDSSRSESKNSTETKDQGDGVVTWVDSRSSGSPYWDRTYTWSRIPSNKAEFRAAKQVLCKSKTSTLDAIKRRNL